MNEPCCICCGIVDPGLGERAETLAERFKALSDPTRVRLLGLILRHGEICVCDLQPNFELSQPTISHHLKVLRDAGLIDTETRGRWAFYSARKEAIAELSSAIDVRLEAAPT
jgi:ArsR family transcriptional regulator